MQRKTEIGHEGLQAPEQKKRRFFEVTRAVEAAQRMEAICFPPAAAPAQPETPGLSPYQERGAALYAEHQRQREYRDKLDSVAWERMRTTLEPAMQHQPLQYSDQPKHELQPQLAEEVRQQIASIHAEPDNTVYAEVVPMRPNLHDEAASEPSTEEPTDPLGYPWPRKDAA